MYASTGDYRHHGEAMLALGQLGTWYPEGALWSADYQNSRYYFDGRVYTSLSDFLVACGGTQDGITTTVGPYIDPTGTNQIINGDFSDGTTGWAAGQTGSSIAVVSGELELTSAGSLNGFSQALTNKNGKAFRLRGTGRRGTSTNTFNLFNGANSILSSGTAIGGNIASTSPATVEGYAAGYPNGSSFVGVRNSSGAGSGTAYFDNFSLVEIWPFLGWQAANVGVAVQATAPPLPLRTKCCGRQT